MSNTSKNDRVETLKNDTSDLLDEAKHRTQATGERVKRTVAGDHLTPGESIASHLKEAGHELKAGADKASRELRHEDTGKE